MFTAPYLVLLGIGFETCLLLTPKGPRVSNWFSGASPPPHVSFRPPAENADAQAVLKAASNRLQGTFHFHTMTIQIEDYSEDMKDCQSCQGPSD